MILAVKRRSGSCLFAKNNLCRIVTGDQLKHRLSIVEQEQITQINSTYQPVLKAKGAAKIKLAECLRMTVHPTDQKGTYEGQLTWTLTNGPQ